MVLWKTWWAGIYRFKYCLGGNYIRRNFDRRNCNNPVGNFLGRDFPDGSFPGWLFSRLEFSRWELSWVGVFRVGIVWGIIRVGIFRVGDFIVPFLLASLLVCSLTLRLSINIISTFMSLFSFITDVNGFFEIPTSPFIKFKKNIRKIWKFHKTLVPHLCFWKNVIPQQTGAATFSNKSFIFKSYIIDINIICTNFECLVKC